MALQGFHDSERSPSQWDIASRSRSQSQQVTDSSQSHHKVRIEPQRTTPRAMTVSA